MNDISPAFKQDYQDETVARALVKLEGTPEAVLQFEKEKEKLSDYGYWFLLSTIWVSYSGYSDLNLWKELFSAARSKKKISIMKPSELKALERLPYEFTVYRAHREEETDWISYTTDIKTAIRFSFERNAPTISEYRVKIKDVAAYFTRRGESEIMVLDKEKAKFVTEILVSDEGENVVLYYPPQEDES